MAAPPPTYNPLLGPPPKSAMPEPVPAPAAPSAPAAAEKASWQSLDLPQPGLWEHMHLEAKGVMAKLYLVDGARVSVSKPVSNNFQVSHTIEMGGQNAYRFGAIYAGEPRFGNPESASPVMQGEVDADGNVFGVVSYHLTPVLKAKMDHRYFNGKGDQTSLELEYKGKDFTASLKAIEPDLVNGAGICQASYLQSITKTVSMGGEFHYQCTQGMHQAVVAMGGRYKNDKATFVGTVTPLTGQANFTYAHKVDEKITLAAELDADLANKGALASVGYQFDLRQNCVRGQIDSNGTIAGILENKLAPGLSFTLTGQINHMTGKSVFGMGFTLG